MEKLKIYIVDRPDIVGRIKRALSDEPAYTVIGSTDNSTQAAELIQSAGPDIVVMGGDLPGFDAAAAISRINRIDGIHTIVLTSRLDEENILPIFREGVDGYVYKDESLCELLLALKAVTMNGVYARKEVMQVVRRHIGYMASDRKLSNMQNELARLTVREKEVFLLLADGKRIKEVAQILHLSPKTVETHKYNIMNKLKLKRMADFTKLAVLKDLLPR